MNKEQMSLDILGEMLMKRARDRAVVNWDMTLDGRMKDARSQSIHSRLSVLGPECVALIHDLIPEVVESVLHFLLSGLDEEKRVEVCVHSDEGIVPSVRDVSDGLAGELYGPHGWIARFAQQRHRDPNEDS